MFEWWLLQHPIDPKAHGSDSFACFCRRNSFGYNLCWTLIQIKDPLSPLPQTVLMTTQVHGHEVMQMMLDLDRSFTRDSLREAIQERFGAETRFFTCSAHDMTADELIDFLAQKGKFVGDNSGFNTEADRICKH